MTGRLRRSPSGSDKRHQAREPGDPLCLEAGQSVSTNWGPPLQRASALLQGGRRIAGEAPLHLRVPGPRWQASPD